MATLPRYGRRDGFRAGFININDMYNGDVGKGRAQGCDLLLSLPPSPSSLLSLPILRKGKRREKEKRTEKRKEGNERKKEKKGERERKGKGKREREERGGRKREKREGERERREREE